jgi:hypothetical protein
MFLLTSFGRVEPKQASDGLAALAVISRVSVLRHGASGGSGSDNASVVTTRSMNPPDCILMDR